MQCKFAYCVIYEEMANDGREIFFVLKKDCLNYKVQYLNVFSFTFRSTLPLTLTLACNLCGILFYLFSTTHYVLHPLLHPVATSDGKHDKEKERKKIHCIIIHKEKAFTNSWALIFVPSEESIIFFCFSFDILLILYAQNVL